MKYRIKLIWIVVPLIAALTAGFIADSYLVGHVVFLALFSPILISVYVPYAKDNPNQVWFKRKLYGWGWTPVTWQGWLLTLVYLTLVIAFAFTIDENSSRSEVAFTFLIPTVLLTIAFLRIAYRKGETPRWQWGEDKNNAI